jgi:hypothetical protein
MTIIKEDNIDINTLELITINKFDQSLAGTDNFSESIQLLRKVDPKKMFLKLKSKILNLLYLKNLKSFLKVLVLNGKMMLL